MKTIAFFNNKGGVGKTTLAYHVAWMLDHLGARVLVADLDPQANLTAAFLDEEELAAAWDRVPPMTIYGAIEPLLERLGDIRAIDPIYVGRIAMVGGDLSLSKFEDRLGDAWSHCLDDNAANAADAFRVTSAFYRVIAGAAEKSGASVALLDVGPNLGALNRAALVAADCVVVPLAADLFSLRGLANLGPALREWRSGWQTRRSQGRVPKELLLPSGEMRPLGYVVLQHAARKESEPVRAYSRWIDRFPATFHHSVLEDEAPPGDDPSRLALLRHYRSLMPMSLERRKPVFDLRAADGAIGGHAAAVRDAYRAFEALTREIASRAGVEL